MSNRKANDELLAKVLASHNSPMQELNFLNTVFAFLNRKSKYLQQSNARSQIDSIVTKHIEKAKQVISFIHSYIATNNFLVM